jgi:hypothetical protein
MKIFVSWSGTLSQKVACALRDWIPCVLQYARPYVSSEDIDKGTRWSVDIAKELNDSMYGILCVTADNEGAPWLNFEAGALSKAIDRSFVTPFLLNLRASDLKKGPLVQFQATAFSRDEVRKLIESLNNKAGEGERVELATVKRTFDKWWPELEKELSVILQEVPGKSKTSPVPTKQEAMLGELLDLVRSQQRQISSPQTLLPPDYLDEVVARVERAMRPAARDLSAPRLLTEVVELIALIGEMEPTDLQARALRTAERLHAALHHAVDGGYRGAEDESYKAWRPIKPPRSSRADRADRADIEGEE